MAMVPNLHLRLDYDFDQYYIEPARDSIVSNIPSDLLAMIPPSNRTHDRVLSKRIQRCTECIRHNRLFCNGKKPCNHCRDAHTTQQCRLYRRICSACKQSKTECDYDTLRYLKDGKCSHCFTHGIQCEFRRKPYTRKTNSAAHPRTSSR